MKRIVTLANLQVILSLQRERQTEVAKDFTPSRFRGPVFKLLAKL